MKKTKQALLHSGLALLLCISMLIGSTFAWFSDSISSGKNIITAGNLDLEMYWTDDLDSGKWHNVEENGHNTIFNYDNWEPGYTDVKYIKLVNAGDLALNYKLSLTPQNGVGKLAEVINVYFAEGGVAVEQRSNLQSLRSIGLLDNVLNGGATADGTLLSADQYSPLHPSGEVVMTVAMNMLTTAGNEYQNEDAGKFSITALATQAPFEMDSFGSDYDANAEYPTVLTAGSATTTVTPVDNKVPAGGVMLNGGSISAFVPEGVSLEAGTTELTLTVTPLKNTTSDIVVVNDEVLIPVDVHIDGVSKDNTVPIIVDLGEILPKYLNMGNYHLYHVENGSNSVMTLVADKAALTDHNQFTYDPLTGAVSVAMASFSEVTILADTAAKWEGGEDDSWYNATATELYIANADQLYSFAKIAGGMANGIEQDSFAGKTVKLLSDINLNYGTVLNEDGSGNGETKKIFYPIGYWNDDDIANYDDKTNKEISSGFYTFEGVFDGAGHTISNIYQNTWEMKGDHNWYAPEDQHYRDGMGLFGKVYGGTVKNLTVDNFESDGEITTTGVIASYADYGATFENIAITNCNPRVYNIGNGGIVGCVGWYTKAVTDKVVTFKNITVDNSNKISALWGSYDVACGGIVGQYYPTSGQSSANYPANPGIHFENCHVAAVMDVYNDVCANYQYYAYRYAGMMIGSIRENLPADENGHIYPDMTGITAEGCTVHFDTWNDYYYCELVANSKASYTHDHQFSRLEQVESVDVSNMKVTSLKGTTTDIPTSGRYNYVVVNDEHATENATCYHFVDGAVWSHADAGTETVNGVEIAVEDHAHIYLPFKQLFTGYGWGVTSRWLEAFDGIGVTERDSKDLIDKFEKNDALDGDFLYRVGNGNAFPIGKLFQAIDESLVVDSGVHVSVDSLVDGVKFNGTFTKNATDWTQSTLHITGGTGPALLTIQDYNNCQEFSIKVEVVDAENVTSAVGASDKNIVLLNNVTFSSTYLYYKNSTLYGNGFTLDITGADHSDLKDLADTSSNKFAYSNIWMVDSVFNNVKVVGSVYSEVGMTADSDYGNAAIRTEGDCFIVESYISNNRVPLRVQGNTTLVDTVVDGGRYANIELRFGKLTLDGVTTINATRKGNDDTTDVIGFGIVIHDEATNASISVIGDGLKQYNWVGESKHKSILSGDTYLENAYKLVFDSNNSDTIYFSKDEDRYVNTGILCLSASLTSDVVTGLDDRYTQEISSYDAWVLTYDNTKHADWFDASYAVETVVHNPEQYPVIPNYSGNEAQTVEFTKGETYYFDTSVLTAEKNGQTLSISSVTMDGTTYNYGDKIALTEGGVYDVVYAVVDPYNFNSDASATTTVTHNVSVTITAIAKDAAILAPKFTFIDQNGNKYDSTTVKAGDKTYVMPNVTAADSTSNVMDSINIGSATISGTTVYFPIATGYTVRSGSNFNRYYPLFNGINITDYTVAGDTTGATYTTSSDYTSLVGSSGTKFIIPANSGQTNCGDYVKTDGQSGNAAGNSDSGWQGAGYSTSYGGTYLKSGNTSASRGSDANGYERIVWVEYSFNAGNGDVYYYRIGYHCNKESAQTCLTADTLITLEDGTQKRIDQVTYTDRLLVWDFNKGEYAVASSSIIENHGYDWNDVITLVFDDGTKVKVVNAHGFFDADLNKWVDINASNAKNYIGHNFTQVAGNSYKTVKLISAKTTREYVEAWSILTMDHYNCIVEGMFSITPPATEQLAFFEIGDAMKYDDAAKQADIDKYGLFTYEEFAQYMTYEQFEVFNVAEFKVAIGKGMITYEELLWLIATYIK